MMLKYNKRMKEYIEKTLSRILLLQKHVESVLAALACLSKESDLKSGNLVEILWREECKEWRNLFMFGMIVDKETQDKIKAAAYERFLDDHIHVSNFWNSISNWNGMNEEEFRRMCKTLFAPAEAKKMDKDLQIKLGIKTPRKKTLIEKTSNLGIE